MSHILLIEDNQANADMILHILRSAGYEVRHFLRGLEGAKSARREPPELILMDFNLPDIDGRTLSLLLSRQLTGVPIVACTARTGDHEARMAANFGCVAFLSKPFTPEDLLGLVRTILKNHPVPAPDDGQAGQPGNGEKNVEVEPQHSPGDKSPRVPPAADPTGLI